MTPPRMPALPASFAYEYPRKADKERYGADQETGDKRLNEIVFRNGEADRQRVDRGGNALDDKTLKSYCGLSRFVLFALNALKEHLAADKAEQDKSYPRNALFKYSETLSCGGYAYPADHRHCKLK